MTTSTLIAAAALVAALLWIGYKLYKAFLIIYLLLWSNDIDAE